MHESSDFAAPVSARGWHGRRFCRRRMFGEIDGVRKFAIATLTVNPLVMDGFRRLDRMFGNTIYRPSAACWIWRT